MSAALKIDQVRRARLAKVHIGKKQLGWTDDVYRDVLAGRFQAASAKDLTDGQLDELIGYMKTQGFADARPGFRPHATKVSRETNSKVRSAAPHISKIRALWLSLYHLGVVREPKDTAIEAFIARQTKPAGQKKGGVDGIKKLAWLSPQEAFKVIEALKKMALREAACDFAQFKNSRHAVLVSQSRRLQKLGVWPRDQLNDAAGELMGAAPGQGRWLQLVDGRMDVLIGQLGALIRAAIKENAAQENAGG